MLPSTHVSIPAAHLLHSQLHPRQERLPILTHTHLPSLAPLPQPQNSQLHPRQERVPILTYKTAFPAPAPHLQHLQLQQLVVLRHRLQVLHELHR